MNITFKKDPKYNIPQEYKDIIDKYAFEINEFGSHKKIEKLLGFFGEIRGVIGNYIYITALKDVIEFNENTRNQSYRPYYFVINGDIIYKEYIDDVKDLVRLESIYR